MNDVVVTVYFPSKRGFAFVRQWAMERSKALNPKTARILRKQDTGQLALVYENQADIRL